jgi:hypothetical protein
MMTADRIRWLDVAALKSEPPLPVPWVIEPLVARGAVTMLAGPAGVGKSLLAMAVASVVANGTDALAGMSVKAGGVVILDAENGERTLHERAHLVDLPPEGVRLGLSDSFELRRQPDAGQLAQAVAGAALVVLDSLATLAPGLKENDANEAGPVLDRMRRLARESGAGVLLLHHARKDGDTYRGGTALPASMDVAAIYCRERDDPDRERRLLTWEPHRGGKMRLAAEPEPRWLRVGVVADRLTIEPAKPPDRSDDDRPPTRRDVLRERLVAILAERGPLSQSDALREVGESTNSRTGRRALLAAVDGGDLIRDDDGLYVLADNGGGSHDD